jgi:hypothetical protein
LNAVIPGVALPHHPGMTVFEVQQGSLNCRHVYGSTRHSIARADANPIDSAPSMLKTPEQS